MSATPTANWKFDNGSVQLGAISTRAACLKRFPVRSNHGGFSCGFMVLPAMRSIVQRRAKTRS
jgi:hypothetical protein